MEQVVQIPSDGLRLAGVLAKPPGMGEGERRPAFLVLHGFGSTKESENVLGPHRLLHGLGYVTLRFDMRGCGESEGEHGRVICLDQVSDTRNAVSFLTEQPFVDPERIGVIGTSFGGAVAVYAGGTDERIAAVISNGGWGDGERKFRGQHSTPETWARFTRILEEGPRYRERTGQSMMVPRFDIVPVPAHVRQNLADQSVEMSPSRTLLEFPAETVQSMYEFKADTVVGNIAPRPLMLLHSASDSVTPTEQSISLFQHAGQPTELHLFSNVDHWMFAENSSRVWNVLRDWLNKYLPISEPAAPAH